ncbi:hypothetical protein BV25DRAFT_729910 [Artomyces pyxidatus]|uniref:Uncharacterized protein n=1 Tax=Artomyces pyxidatus TaxID=48021 RepID=A0ACB8T0G8_9AGAM|nr:hypothetical protein BV25DRAFT_729910 [Artomyces pyxidatus]
MFNDQTGDDDSFRDQASAEEISSSHTPPSPITRLPNEILRKIMVQIPEVQLPWSERSVVFVSQVCALWRAIAWDTAELWTIIPITTRAQWTELALTRSRGAPISISISLDPVVLPAEDRKREAIGANVRTVLPHLSRARQLSVSGLAPVTSLGEMEKDEFNERWQASLSNEVIEALKEHSMPFLETLRFSAADYLSCRLSNSLFTGQAPPNLRKLTLENTWFNLSIPTPHILPPSLTSLEIIDLDHEWGVLEVLRRLPALQTLVLSGVSIAWPNPEINARVALPHLRQITIRTYLQDAIKLFPYLDLPSNAELHLAVWSRDRFVPLQVPPFQVPLLQAPLLQAPPLQELLFLDPLDAAQETFDDAQAARMVDELGQVYLAHISTPLAMGSSFRTLSINRSQPGGWQEKLGLHLSDPISPAVDDSNIRGGFPQSLSLIIRDWLWRNIAPSSPHTSPAPLVVPLSSVLPIMPALGTVVELTAGSGSSGLLFAEEWPGVAGILPNVEKIAVEAGAARGLILALRQAAESTSHLFPNLGILFIERVILLDTVDEISSNEPYGSPFWTSVFQRRVRAENTDTLFIALLKALQLRIDAGSPFRLVLRRCSLTMEMVLSLRGCLGPSLEWDGQLDGARRYTSRVVGDTFEGYVV